MTDTRHATCNGWKNRATWNIALWMNNDITLYEDAVRFMRDGGLKQRHPYRQFICSRGLRYERTPDRFKFMSDSLDYKALDEMMREYGG